MGGGTQFASGGVLHYPSAALLPPRDYQNVAAPPPLYQNTMAMIGPPAVSPPPPSRAPPLPEARVAPAPPPTLLSPLARTEQQHSAPASVGPRLSDRSDANSSSSKMVAGIDMFTATAAMPLHHHHQHKFEAGGSNSASTALLLQQHHRKLQLQQQEISEQILLLKTQVLQKQLEQLQQTKQQLKKELEEQQQQLPSGSLLLNPLPSLLPPQSSPTPALLITATQSAFAVNPRLEVARLNVFSGQQGPPPEVAITLPDIGGILGRTRAQLADCGWYHGCLSWQESDMLLENTALGTFLLRDSQNPSCIYSLSVQRGPQLGGPTSIRIQFQGGRFALDAESEQIRRLMPAFDSVGELVEYYVGLSSSSKQQQQQLMLDSCHQQQQQQAPIVLRGPLYHQPPSLAHLCRLAVNRSLLAARSGRKDRPSRSGRVEQLSLPPKLASYLDAYTLSI